MFTTTVLGRAVHYFPSKANVQNSISSRSKEPVGAHRHVDRHLLTTTILTARVHPVHLTMPLRVRPPSESSCDPPIRSPRASLQTLSQSTLAFRVFLCFLSFPFFTHFPYALPRSGGWIRLQNNLICILARFLAFRLFGYSLCVLALVLLSSEFGMPSVYPWSDYFCHNAFTCFLTEVTELYTFCFSTLPRYSSYCRQV